MSPRQKSALAGRRQQVGIHSSLAAGPPQGATARGAAAIRTQSRTEAPRN
ncbi:MAG: hypothetical protein KKF85_08400 [Gammaproteobacteria bacterium]|nr:hypothetical protein [Gammaproteobacteria bacterium]MBU3988805.1 hypothetical protein [Gammaproteobacteria bacterium]MBU4004482.1 hypothetical protein [Gammaproteobacteria bacterium]MBU4022681.1 hypothetical protein [Gammaproteobacteria bacterium]MBU4097181.1 hypothetical protein [Gammaproteobacteria bacterium]